jgi:hypothetical protein
VGVAAAVEKQVKDGDAVFESPPQLGYSGYPGYSDQVNSAKGNDDKLKGDR